MDKRYLLLLVPVLLILGLWAGLVRIGWQLPVSQTGGHHGFLMVSGFFGTVIALERTLIGRNHRWLFIPVVNAFSIPALLMKFETVAFTLSSIAALAFAAFYILQLVKYKEAYMAVQILAVFSWCGAGAMLLNGVSYPSVLPFWILFLLLTIVSERLELSKFKAKPAFAQKLLFALAGALFTAQFFPFHGTSQVFSGICYALIGAWLLRYDMAWLNAKKEGLRKYMGITLIIGYCWLIICGMLIAIPGELPAMGYDAVVHAFFIGFVFAMLFAHAPVIFPSLVGITSFQFSTMLYVPVVLSQFILIARIAADFAFLTEFRQWMGLVQVIVFLMFFGMIARLLIKSKRNGA